MFSLIKSLNPFRKKKRFSRKEIIDFFDIEMEWAYVTRITSDKRIFVESCSISFSDMDKVSKHFETRKIDIQEGCDSCGYGTMMYIDGVNIID